MGRITWSPTKPSDGYLAAPCVCPACSTGSVPSHFGEWLGTEIFAITGCAGPRSVADRSPRWLSFVMPETKRGKRT